MTIAQCCSLAIPENSTFEPIDDPGYRLTGEGLEASFVTTAMGGGAPVGLGPDRIETRERNIDGRSAMISIYRSDGPADLLPERRHLRWALEGSGEGDGTTLVVDFSCEAAGCAVFQPMIESLRRTR